jgi:hypothetical protein
MDYLQFIELLWIPAGMMFTWQQKTINRLAEKLEEKSDIKVVTEMQADIKELLKLLNEHRIEMGRWQGLTEQKQQKS